MTRHDVLAALCGRDAKNSGTDFTDPFLCFLDAAGRSDDGDVRQFPELVRGDSGIAHPGNAVPGRAESGDVLPNGGAGDDPDGHPVCDRRLIGQ